MKCTHCELFFNYGYMLEIHHKIAKKNGGKDLHSNLELLHRHYHDQKHGTQELKTQSNRLSRNKRQRGMQ